jgi:AcrR family transcriptional regulator
MMDMADDVTDKRAAIMKAALILFTQRGFHGTPTAMISKSAGVSTGTLFRCFETKNDLINSVYFSAKERLGRATCAGLEQEKDVRGKLKLLWGNTIRWGVENSFEFLFIEQFCSSPFITDVTQEQVERNFSFLFDLLEEGARSGALRDMDRNLALEMLYSANVAVVKKLIETGDTKDLDKIISRSFDIVWSGIAHR